jgi:Protein BYPASS1-related
MDAHDPSFEQELEWFQRRVSDLYADLSSSPDEILSLAWIRKLLEGFLVTLEEFRVILFNHRSAVIRPPLDRTVSDFFERAVKALDVCNAVRDGVGQIRQWNKHVEVVVQSLSTQSEVDGTGANKTRPFGEGQLRRGKKTLMDLTVLIVDEKEPNSASHRNRSFGRSKDSQKTSSSSSVSHLSSGVHFRSLSWSVSRTWSAARQLQNIAANLNVPRGHDVTATAGLAIPVYTISTLLVFTMWALVAAIPCQDRGLQIHFSIPRSGFMWSLALLSLHEKITEESKRKDRRNANGLMKEIQQIEKSSHQLLELLDGVEMPIGEEKDHQLKNSLQELENVSGILKEGLEPLERQIREVFHRIVRSRTEGLDSLSHGNE